MTIKHWLIAFLLIAQPAFADKQFNQVYVSGLNTPSATLANYNILFGGGSWNATENNRKSVMGASGNLTNFRVTTTAAGAGKSMVISVRVNGSTSALSCTFNDASTTECLDTSIVAVNAGDEISILSTPTSTPAVGLTSFSCNFIPTTPGLNHYGGGSFSTGLSSIATEYLAPQASNGITATEFDSGFLMPFAGTIEALYIELTVAPDAGAGVQTRTFTVRVNATTDSDCVVTISDAALTGNDTSCSTAFSAGDYLTIKSEVSLAPAATLVWTGMAVQPSTVGQFALGISGYLPDPSAESFNRVNAGSNSSSSPNRNNRSQETNDFVGQSIYMLLNGDPDNGAGTQSYTATLEDTTVDTTIAVTISDGATSNNATGLNVQLSGNDLLTWDIDPANTPTSRTTMISVGCFNQPKRGILIE